MARKPLNYTKAELLYGSMAVVDQYKRIMAVSNAAGRTFFVMRQQGISIKIVVMPAVGEESIRIGIETRDIELGSTKKNLTASFRLWHALQEILPGVMIDNHDGKPMNIKKEVELYWYFLHTVFQTCIHGGFHSIPESEIEADKQKISEAENILQEYSGKPCDRFVTWEHDYSYLYERACSGQPGNEVWWDDYNSEEEFWECNGI